MPKWSLEEAGSLAAGLDGEWAGRSVMLRPAAARGKRLPETMVAKICRVSRHATHASVLLQHSANGVSKTCALVWKARLGVHQGGGFAVGCPIVCSILRRLAQRTIHQHGHWRAGRIAGA